MVDDKYDSGNATWFKDRWQIDFTGNSYSIGSDNGITFAINTLKKDKNLSNINLNDDYGVTLAFSGSCATDAKICFVLTTKFKFINLLKPMSKY